jgi:hypothetical protein
LQWSSFLGAFLGAVVGSLILIGGFTIWDEIERRKSKTRSPSLNDILESHLEQCIVEHFNLLFPGWQIYNVPTMNADGSDSNDKPSGIRYRTEAGEIDILCTNSNNQFLIIELKRGKAPDRVTAQMDRYITWVQRNLAQEGQQVRGLIIAKSIDSRLAYTLSRRPNIDFWAYDWLLEFNKNASGEVLQAQVLENTEIKDSESRT